MLGIADLGKKGVVRRVYVTKHPSVERTGLLPGGAIADRNA